MLPGAALMRAARHKGSQLFLVLTDVKRGADCAWDDQKHASLT